MLKKVPCPFLQHHKYWIWVVFFLKCIFIYISFCVLLEREKSDLIKMLSNTIWSSSHDFNRYLFIQPLYMTVYLTSLGVDSCPIFIPCKCLTALCVFNFVSYIKCATWPLIYTSLWTVLMLDFILKIKRIKKTNLPGIVFSFSASSQVWSISLYLLLSSSICVEHQICEIPLCRLTLFLKSCHIWLHWFG